MVLWYLASISRKHEKAPITVQVRHFLVVLIPYDCTTTHLLIFAGTSRLSVAQTWKDEQTPNFSY